MQNIWAIICRVGSIWIAWIQVYVLKGRSIWQHTASPSNSWSWRKLMKLRSFAQEFIEIKDGKERWKLTGEKYRAAEVWSVIRPKKSKVSWHKLVWSTFNIPKHAFITWLAILNKLPTKDRLKA